MQQGMGIGSPEVIEGRLVRRSDGVPGGLIAVAESIKDNQANDGWAFHDSSSHFRRRHPIMWGRLDRLKVGMLHETQCTIVPPTASWCLGATGAGDSRYPVDQGRGNHW